MAASKPVWKILNEKVVSVQEFCRPMVSSDDKNLPIVYHCGVKAETEEGNFYLVHKGPGFDKNWGGSEGSTVATPAYHMSDKWKERGPVYPVDNGTRVRELIQAGGIMYNILKGQHCLKATSDMIHTAIKK